LKDALRAFAASPECNQLKTSNHAMRRLTKVEMRGKGQSFLTCGVFLAVIACTYYYYGPVQGGIMWSIYAKSFFILLIYLSLAFIIPGVLIIITGDDSSDVHIKPMVILEKTRIQAVNNIYFDILCADEKDNSYHFKLPNKSSELLRVGDIGVMFTAHGAVRDFKRSKAKI
jgi:hypothetical protein